MDIGVSTPPQKHPPPLSCQAPLFRQSPPYLLVFQDPPPPCECRSSLVSSVTWLTTLISSLSSPKINQISAFNQLCECQNIGLLRSLGHMIKQLGYVVIFLTFLYSAKQMSGFCMKHNIGLKWVNQIGYDGSSGFQSFLNKT